MRSDEELLMQGIRATEKEITGYEHKGLDSQIKKGKEWSDLVSAVSEKCDWRYDDVVAFVSDLLEECNFHTARKYVVRCMVDKDW